mmetsp:Transcript_12971/g.47419  ORF Transcript_12971/g.47419 Transcript_12971/m.47419 type:complete len:194 (-) Transcript_12971:691-1272(-)
MQRRGGVAEASFCYLVLELVQHNMHQHPSQAPHRLDAMGFDVGLRLAERHSKDHPRFADQLEVIKYLCKDLWTEAFGKPVDNLKTNHRGVFVLQDNKFQHLMHLSGSAAAKSVPQSNVAGHDIVICSPETSCTELPEDSSKSVSSATDSHLHFPCGLIRGALGAFGVVCTVRANVEVLPVCAFTITVTARDRK